MCDVKFWSLESAISKVVGNFDIEVADHIERDGKGVINIMADIPIRMVIVGIYFDREYVTLVDYTNDQNITYSFLKKDIFKDPTNMIKVVEMITTFAYKYKKYA